MTAPPFQRFIFNKKKKQNAAILRSSLTYPGMHLKNQAFEVSFPLTLFSPQRKLQTEWSVGGGCGAVPRIAAWEAGGRQHLTVSCQMQDDFINTSWCFAKASLEGGAVQMLECVGGRCLYKVQNSRGQGNLSRTQLFGEATQWCECNCAVKIKNRVP